MVLLRLRSSLKENWVSIGVLVAFFLYLAQSIAYATFQASVLDEGAYLYKGYLFASGQYTPFQDYGPWTNHMPLSFLIPGYIQYWFEPGLRVGRYAAILIGFLGLVGIWLTAHRLGGKKWGLFAAAAIGLNPSLIKAYSIASSQVLVFAFVAWILFFILGSGRARWHLLAGTALASLLFLTRINLSPVLLLVFLFIFWQYGRQEGVWALTVGLAIIGTAILVYYPNIVHFVLRWTPETVDSLVSSVMPPRYRIGGGIREVVPFPQRVDSFLIGFRSHFLFFWCVVLSLFLWRRPSAWSRKSDWKNSLFLLSLFAILLLAHAYNSLARNSCVYCFENYLAFFSPVAIFLLYFSMQIPSKNFSSKKFILLSAVFVIAMVGVGYGLDNNFKKDLLSTRVPYFKGFRVQPGSVELWSLPANKFGVSYEQLLITIPVVTAIGIAIAVIGAALLIWKFMRRIFPEHATPNSALLALIFLFALAFSPTKWLANNKTIYECGRNVLASHEAVGAALRGAIPPGSQIYWAGGQSAVPMLSIPDSSIYPAQINAGYSLRDNPNTEALLIRGFWSFELAYIWLGESDYALVWQEAIAEEGFKSAIDAHYTLVGTTPPQVDCRTNGPIYIYKNDLIDP